MSTINISKAFTIKDILNSNGFTLDTTDFKDMLEDDEEDYTKNTQLNNEEMLKFLNLSDSKDVEENVKKNDIKFIGVSFESLKSQMTCVYGNGEIYKLVKEEGIGELVPPNGQATLEYVGYFEYQDEPFDSTFFHNNTQFVINLGKGRIIEGLEIAIRSMKKYETSIFIIQPHLAYGHLGCKPRIPPNSEVLFKVRILDFLDNGNIYIYDDLTSEEKKQFSIIQKIAQSLINTANNNVGKKKITQAIREYNRAVHYLEGSILQNDEEEENMNKILFRALLNLMVCYNKINKPKLVCYAYERLPKKNGKAYFQHAKALIKLSEYERAMTFLQKAYELIPDSDNIKREIQKLENIRIKYKDYMRRFAQNSLKIANKRDNENSAFENIAKEFCENFIREKALKQELSNGLCSEELQCIRKVAASYNIFILKEIRFNTERLYLVSKEYYKR